MLLAFYTVTFIIVEDISQNHIFFFFLQSNSGPEMYRNTTLVDRQNGKYQCEMEQVSASVFVFAFEFILVAVGLPHGYTAEGHRLRSFLKFLSMPPPPQSSTCQHMEGVSRVFLDEEVCV